MFRKNHLRYPGALLIFFLLQVPAWAQNAGDQLRQLLLGKNTLTEIMTVVDSFYLTRPADERDNGGDGLIKYKHWKRWEWYMAPRLGPQGEFIHIPRHNLEAIRRERARRPDSRTVIEGSWRSVGMSESLYVDDPVNSYGNGSGRVDRVAFHPSDENTFYIGSPHGGLWRTTDGGDEWECLTDTLPSIGISGIVVNSVNPSSLYILTGTGDVTNANYFINLFGLALPSMGVFKSHDAGLTWTATDDFPLSSGVTIYSGCDLVQSPTDTSTLLAATTDGIFRTTNGGTSWTKTKSGLVFDLEYKPGSGLIVYAADNDSIFYSGNGGLTWNASSLNVAPASVPDRIALAASPSSPNTVYALFGGVPAAGQFSGLYRSTNSGINFTRMSTTPNILGYNINGGDNGQQAVYDLCIAVHPDTANKIMTGGVNLWKSANSGTTLTNYSGWYETQGGEVYCHSDHHAVAYNPLNNKFYSFNDGGVWVTEGDTMVNISRGLILNQFYGLAQASGPTYKLAGGLQDNGVKYRQQGVEEFLHMYGADGFATSFVANSNTQFYATINQGIRRFNMADTSQTGISVPGSSGNFFKEVLAHTTDTNLVFYGDATIFRSTDGGSNWSNVGASGIWGMTVAPGDSSRMYAAGGNGPFAGAGNVFTSSNKGLTWTTISGNPGFPAAYNMVTDIEVDPFNAAIVYVIVGGVVNGSKIYRSSNFGASWINYSGDLPNVTVNSIGVVSDGVFVGTDISVYYRGNSSPNWIDIGENLPHCPVTELLYDPNSGTLTAATFGRGVWQRSYCIDDIYLSYPLVGNLYYACDDELTSVSEIPGSATDSVIFQAGGKIMLHPGFKVGEGGYLKARIDACDNGEIPFAPPGDVVSRNQEVIRPEKPQVVARPDVLTKPVLPAGVKGERKKEL